MFTTLMPALNAALTVERSCGPKMGWRMIPLYCFDCTERLQLLELLVRVVVRVEDGDAPGAVRLGDLLGRG